MNHYRKWCFKCVLLVRRLDSSITSITRFVFVIPLVVSEHILQSTVFLSKFLQGIECDLLEATKECKTVIELLRAERWYGRNVILIKFEMPQFLWHWIFTKSHNETLFSTFLLIFIIPYLSYLFCSLCDGRVEPTHCTHLKHHFL
jgi:hypothetical protein